MQDELEPKLLAAQSDGRLEAAKATVVHMRAREIICGGNTVLRLRAFMRRYGLDNTTREYAAQALKKANREGRLDEAIEKLTRSEERCEEDEAEVMKKELRGKLLRRIDE